MQKRIYHCFDAAFEIVLPRRTKLRGEWDRNEIISIQFNLFSHGASHRQRP